MGKIIRSPEIINDSTKKIFLAGGISNCPDWQEPVGSKIANETNLTVINPRRYEWNMDSQDQESINQIKWEFNFLSSVEIILFWFPKETLCPITLLELGAALHKDVNLYIGCHEQYQRKLDVTVQSKLVRPSIKIHLDLNEMVNCIINDFKRD